MVFLEYRTRDFLLKVENDIRREINSFRSFQERHPLFGRIARIDAYIIAFKDVNDAYKLYFSSNLGIKLAANTLHNTEINDLIKQNYKL
ncbi:hypothetical protein AA18889_1085 [Acetobacter senegalensis DSM 18889]|nr:hypothetical protein AA18889_1085 [Acetobacter senegalensis DSM 18889]